MIIVFILIILVYFLIKIYSPKIKGSIGEAKVNTRLNFLGKEYIVLKDILINRYKKHEDYAQGINFYFKNINSSLFCHQLLFLVVYKVS